MPPQMWSLGLKLASPIVLDSLLLTLLQSFWFNITTVFCYFQDQSVRSQNWDENIGS